MTQASTLSIRVGATAAARLRAQGMHPDLFSVMVGASGGPKWFILSGMDSYLAGEFLPRRTSPMDLLGSSVGGWRMTAHACPDPVAALDHFRDHYHHLRYPEKATPSVISQSSRAMIASFVGGDTASAVCTHSRYRLHIVTAACRGLMASESRSAQLPGLALAAGANALSRRWLAGFFHRSLFHVPHSQAPFLGLSDFPTEQVALTERNLAAVLEATGAIPLVLEGVKGIEGSQHAVHRDGGIIDYHFDIPFANADQGLVLYPHFYPKAIPGWFDKGLSWRRPAPAHYDNVVMIAPSASLVASLPYAKISDRNDFKVLDDAARIRYWQAVIDAGRRMADEFDQRLQAQQWEDVLAPF